MFGENVEKISLWGLVCYLFVLSAIGWFEVVKPLVMNLLSNNLTTVNEMIFLFAIVYLSLLFFIGVIYSQVALTRDIFSIKDLIISFKTSITSFVYYLFVPLLFPLVLIGLWGFSELTYSTNAIALAFLFFIPWSVNFVKRFKRREVKS